MTWDPISAGSSSLGFIGGGQVGAGCWLRGGCHQTGGGSGTSRCGKTCKSRKKCLLQKCLLHIAKIYLLQVCKYIFENHAIQIVHQNWYKQIIAFLVRSKWRSYTIIFIGKSINNYLRGIHQDNNLLKCQGMSGLKISWRDVI